MLCKILLDIFSQVVVVDLWVTSGEHLERKLAVESSYGHLQKDTLAIQKYASILALTVADTSEEFCFLLKLIASRCVQAPRLLGTDKVALIEQMHSK